MEFKENVSLSEFSNYKIGGSARFFFAPKDLGDIENAVAEAKNKKLPIFILGGGTNLLLDDQGFDGTVIKPELCGIEHKGDAIVAGSGTTIAQLLDYSIAHSFSGLEWAGGLPGTLGGAIRGNAGCFGGEIKDVVALVQSFDMKSMKMIDRSAADCAFGYRDSFFKKNGGEIILSATLRFTRGDQKEIAQAIQEKIEHRKKHHPLEYPNIGSIFKNVSLASIHPQGSISYDQAVKDLMLEFRGSHFSIKTDPFPVISTAKLISESGLRGVSFGGAMISPKHPNFIVNTLHASSEDVKNLITLAKTTVAQKFGVELEEEIQMV